MSASRKRPPGRRPKGATWLEEEGRYEYGKEYYDAREQALKISRAKAYANQKEKLKMLKQARPHLWDKTKPAPTLDRFLRKDVSARTDTTVSGAKLSECICVLSSSQTKGDTSSA